MSKKFLVKPFSDNLSKELDGIAFSREYKYVAENKLKPLKIKIFGLKTPAGNILKQLCLSSGFDCMVSRDTVTCKTKTTDALICATRKQISDLTKKLKLQPFGLKDLASELEEYITERRTFIAGGREFSNRKTVIAGILNITPDSFSDGGRYFEIENALKRADEMISDGAEIIDVGGESTRPGSTRISPEAEIERVLPVIKELNKTYGDKILLSVDTLNPQTAKVAIDSGARVINTVTRPETFEKLFPIMKDNEISLIVTHSEEIPPKPVTADCREDIVDKISKYFFEKREKCEGLSLIFDPGIGFSKSINDSFELIKRAGEFLPFTPVMFAISRKSFMKKTFEESDIDEVTNFYHQVLVEKGVNILRVHNTKDTAKIVNYFSKIR